MRISDWSSDVCSSDLSRELDGKLVLACTAAERGHTVFFGCRTRMHRAAHRLPPSLYLGKGLTRRALKSFDAMGRLGHKVMAWDEEDLVYMTPEMYRRRKLSPATLARPDMLDRKSTRLKPSH